MKKPVKISLLVVTGLLTGVAIIAFFLAFRMDAKPVIVKVNVPELSTEAKIGRSLFEENCKVCHGKNAGGSGQGPPLVHKIYRPNHHGDDAFVLAGLRGVRSHHWRFGNMPPVPLITKKQLLKITVYVRQLQRANGIN